MPTQQVVEVETVILSIQAGTVTLVPALTDIEPYAAPMDEVDDNALTPVPRALFSVTIDFPMCDDKNSIPLRIQVSDLKDNICIDRGNDF